MEHLPKTGISYFGNRNPRHFQADLADIKNHNCTFVVHTYSENDQQFYRQTVAEMVKMTRDAGLEVYLDPWGVGRVFGGEAYSSFALHNLNACQILPDGSAAPAVCFNNTKFRRFMKSWIDDAADMGADVLFWDEPHFYIDLKNKEKYKIWYCQCEECSRRFMSGHGTELPNASYEQIVMFREDCVVEFMNELCVLTHANNMKNAVCMLPFKDTAIGLSDWSRIASIPKLDILGTDPYWMFFNKELDTFVGSFSTELVDLCEKYHKEPQIWIQGYKIELGREDELRDAAAIAYKAGIRNFATWSYSGNVYMSYNRSENPERVWAIVGEIYDQIARGVEPY